ncbi:MAG TPA: Ku protein [Gemmataceae bacterium]|nr:Ku protein [Gemmataceae bacterium]
MPSRPSWEGFLKFNLIAVPVKAYGVTVSGGGKIGFHMLHKKCNSRIRYKKVCPIHGEVSNDEIVSAYEFAKGQYVTVEPEEIENLRTENEKTIGIDTFIRPEDLEPVFFSGRSYYLVPDGRVAQKPYAVFQEVLSAKQRLGIAQVVFSGRTQLAVVLPMKELLCLSLLNYSETIKKPKSFEDDLTHPDVSAEERRLAETLVETATAEDFDIDRYKDEYQTNLMRLLDAKAKGKKIVAERKKDEEPAVINLMDALRQSLDRAQKKGGEGGGHRRGSKRVAGRVHKGRNGRHRKTA